MRFTRFLALVLMFAGTAVTAAADEIMFAYKFDPGSSHRYRVETSQEVDMGNGGMRQLADFEVTLKCESFADGKATMHLTFDKVDMSRELFGSLQSDGSGEALVGRTLVFTADPAGNVTDIKPLKFFDGWEQVQSFVEPIVQSWYLRLPNKPIARGEGWSTGQKEKGMGGVDVTVDADAVFKEMKKQSDRECARVQGDLATAITGQSATGMGTYNVQGAGKGKFELFFDPAAGLPVKMKASMSVEMDLSPSAGGDNAFTTNTSYQVERSLI